MPAVDINEIRTPRHHAAPVERGLVSAAAMAEYLRDRKAIGPVYMQPPRRLKRAARFGALHVQAVLNGWPTNPPVCAGSIRYWWLMAHHEVRWAEAMGRKSRVAMLPSERAAADLIDLNCVLSTAGEPYRKISRRWLILMRKYGDQRSAARIEAVPPAARRDTLIACRQKRAPALRAVLASMRGYQRVRTLASSVVA